MPNSILLRARARVPRTPNKTLLSDTNCFINQRRRSVILTIFVFIFPICLGFTYNPNFLNPLMFGNSWLEACMSYAAYPEYFRQQQNAQFARGN